MTKTEIEIETKIETVMYKLALKCNFSHDILLINVYTSNLAGEGIDDQSFDLIDEETMKILFPKMGPRLRFRKFFNKLKNESEKSHQSDEDCHPIDVGTLFVCICIDFSCLEIIKLLVISEC